MKKVLLITLTLCLAFVTTAQENKPIITVLDFETTDISETEMRSIISLLSSALFKTNKFTVIDVSERETILEEINFSLSGCTDDSCSVEIGKLLSAEMIVTGSIAKVGSNLILSTKILETNTSRTINTADGIYPDLDALVVDIRTLANELSNHIGDEETTTVVEDTAEETDDTVTVEITDSSVSVNTKQSSGSVLPLASYGVGAVGTLGGAVFTFLAYSTYQDYWDAAQAYLSATTEEDIITLRKSKDDLYSDFMSKTIIAGVGVGVGLLGFAGGLFLNNASSNADVAIGVNPITQTAGINVQFHF